MKTEILLAEILTCNISDYSLNLLVEERIKKLSAKITESRKKESIYIKDKFKYYNI